MTAMPPIFEGRRRGQLAILIGFALGQALAAGVIAVATRDVFAAFRADQEAPLAALGAILAAGVAIAALRYGERVVAERLGQDYSAALRLKIFLHLTRVSARTLAGRRVGHLSMRFVGDLSSVRNWVSLGLARLVSATIVLPATIAVLFLLDTQIAIAAALPIAAGVVAMALAASRLRGAHKKLRARRARLAADMTERVVHAPELRLLGRVGIEQKHLTSRTKSMVQSALARAKGIALLRVVPDVLSGLVAAIVFLTAFQTGASGAVAAGSLAALALALQQLRDLSGVWDRNRGFEAARERCLALLATPTLPTPSAVRDRTVADRAPEVRFEDVSAPGLQAISVTAKAGRKVAIVGGNGAGKSALLSLAAGLEVSTRGRITLAGQDVARLSTGERRRMIAYQSARSPILAGSLRRALTMGASTRPTDEAVEDCALAFGLGPVLERLGGLDGVVAEGGRNLSSGEVRRLLLSRVALSGPRLILLDEPDDALDSAARALLETLILSTDATALVATHDLALAGKMDEIWILDRGHLVATGRPRDVVLEYSGLFRPRDANVANCSVLK